MLDTGVVLDGSDLELSVTYAGAPRDSAVLAELAKYEIYEIPMMEEGDQEYKEYEEFLQRALKPLGLYREDFLPDLASTCYKIVHCGHTEAIFRLTAAGEDSVFHRVIPCAERLKILEVNNVAVDVGARGELLLGIILKSCARVSYAKGYQAVAGIVRHEVLPLFVDFGTVPVHHEALHILGDRGICDYVTYFMTDDEMQHEYALSRSYQYFHRKVTMKAIDADMARLRAACDGQTASRE